MSNDPASLSNLAPIVIPDPPPVWPPGPGGFMIVSILLLMLLLSVFFLLKRWKQNRYRRLARALIKDSVTTHELSILLKRVALAAYPREHVASLYGEQWIVFLNMSCPKTQFHPRFLEDMDQPPHPEFINSATVWIKHHQVADSLQHER